MSKDTTEQIAKELDSLAQLMRDRDDALGPLDAQIAALDASIEPQIAALEASIEPQLQAVRATIEVERGALVAKRDGLMAALDETIAATEAAVRGRVLTLGTSVKGASLQAVYSKGKMSWDSKFLQGYAIAVPDILKACEVGEPSVAIKGIKKD